MTRALFLDRDGTLIVDVGYPRDPATVALLPGAAAALAALPSEVALVIVTNQSGLARGMVTPAEAAAVQAQVERQFAAAGVRFAGVYVCPHGPDDGCRCRKPAPGMLLDAARDLGLDLDRSLMIGDKAADVAAGRAAGCAALRFAEDPGPGVDVVGWPAASATLAAFFAA
ncbi:MAG: HAD-IIIA family hydrolase [Myxococcales bacterium]|nr:HAD-IIIA family hydrolase [Myxococcales bacterium]